MLSTILVISNGTKNIMDISVMLDQELSL